MARQQSPGAHIGESLLREGSDLATAADGQWSHKTSIKPGQRPPRVPLKQGKTLKMGLTTFDLLFICNQKF